MALVTRETSGLELRIDKKGVQRLYVDGKKFPSTMITVSSTGPHSRGTLTIETLTQFVTIIQEED